MLISNSSIQRGVPSRLVSSSLQPTCHLISVLIKKELLITLHHMIDGYSRYLTPSDQGFHPLVLTILAPAISPTLPRIRASKNLTVLANPRARAFNNPPAFTSTFPAPRASLRTPNETPLLLLQPYLPPKTNDQPIIQEWLAGLPNGEVEMFQFSEKYAPVPATPNNSPPRSLRASRVGSWTITPRKIAVFTGALVSLILLNTLLSAFEHPKVRASSPTAECFSATSSPTQSLRPAYLTTKIPYNATFLPNAAFQPPEPLPHRISDTIDTFAGYKYRNTCNISSLDLHAPFAPLCPDRTSMLTAMSSGGRIGHDAPYMPRGCDMRWFSTEEICEILSRFEKVIIIGDSMMRHVIGSINVLVRKDLGYGAVTDWNFSPEERSAKEVRTRTQGKWELTLVQPLGKNASAITSSMSKLAPSKAFSKPPMWSRMIPAALRVQRIPSMS